MKLRQLHINQFGHFSECDVAIPAEGLQVIYGPNEAGKTTLLQFLRGLLFDFPTRTPYDFKAGTEIAGVGTLILGDGRTVELRRRKGTKNKVNVKINGQETGLDEVGFQRLIGNANRSLFESIFAFGLDQLSQGEESLKHESLQSALFGGGLGNAASPERILQELERQAAELFSPIARKPSINQLLSELKDLPRQIKDKSLRSDDYLNYCRLVKEADERAAALHQSVDRLRREHGRLEKLCRAHQKWAELQQSRNDRAPLSVPKSLPPDARARYASLSEKIQSGIDEAAKLASSLATLERDLQALKLDPRAVSYRAEIRACLEMKQSFLEAKADLPKLSAEHAASRQQIDRELSELRPGWSHEDLRRFAVDVALRADIDRLIEEDRSRQTTQAELRAKREQLSAQLQQDRADLKTLGEPRDVSDLIAILSDGATYKSNFKVLEKLASEFAKIKRSLATQLKKLTPGVADADSVRDLPVPRIATIKQFQADFAELREQLRTADNSLQQDEAERTQIQSKLDEVTSRGVVPSLNDRDAARQKRDDTWMEIRHHLIDTPGEAWGETDPQLQGDVFEQAVRDADAIADLIYANADAVARREELRRQFDQLTTRIDDRRERMSDLKRQEVELHQRWVAVWNMCGFEPLEPEAMQSWVTDHEAVCDMISKRDELLAETELLQKQIDAFEERLRLVCGDASDIPVLLVRAQSEVDNAKALQHQSRELLRNISRLEPQLDECDAKFQTVSDLQEAWTAAWQSVLHRLRFPTDFSTELTRTVIERLLGTRVKLDSLPQEEQRLSAMQARLNEFAARVRPLCEDLASNLLSDPPELAIEKLSDQLDRAAEAQKQFDQLCRERDQTADQHRLVESRTAKLVTENKELFAAAQVQTEIEFFEVVARAEKIAQLDSDIDQRTREIDLIRAGEDQEEFERLLSQQEPDLLDNQRRDLADQLNAAEQQKREADGAAAVAKNELARRDGSGEAAILTDQLSRKRSHLAAEVDRYVPLVFARHLLSEAVRRFERENQPEMIDTVSRLINQMTAGRYVQFDRTTGNTQGILIRRYDGVERTPEQLSSGTREQLYLAIRLAYVLHYCRQNEPLPIVMDDVLVNFDDDRVRQTLMTLTEVAKSVQILFFTCHPHMVALAREVAPNLQPIELPTTMNSNPVAAST
eukprot:TRINITY_DN276_c3_g2_i1.p1 TRINITY_DN276_c3_g2~~TRINITY_DN276_c3_g2_i1.p1  ORF type:complete len:1164 (+),score=321.96 TRINITY_DN276_c3_g2_i1:7427-10918(+)